MTGVWPPQATSGTWSTTDTRLLWNDHLIFDASDFTAVMNPDIESLSLFDLSDPGLFLFPNHNPRLRSDGTATLDDSSSTSTATMCTYFQKSNKEVTREEPDRKASSRVGNRGLCSTSWTGETSALCHESTPGTILCSPTTEVREYEFKRHWQTSGPFKASSPVGSPLAVNGVRWTCEVCGRHCRDSRALQ